MKNCALRPSRGTSEQGAEDADLGRAGTRGEDEGALQRDDRRVGPRADAYSERWERCVNSGRGKRRRKQTTRRADAVLGIHHSRRRAKG